MTLECASTDIDKFNKGLLYHDLREIKCKGRHRDVFSDSFQVESSKRQRTISWPRPCVVETLISNAPW